MDEKALLAKIEALEKEVARLSKHTDAVEVQNLMSRYIFYMENGKIAEVWDDLWSHTNPDVRVEIMDSGAYLGQEHVKRVWYTMGRRMDKHGNMIDTTPKVGEMSNTNTDRAFLLLMLTISSPMIEISEDGKFARGTWFDHSATNMYSASLTDKDQEQPLIPYMVFIARYVHEFKKIDGKWYLSNFYWEPLINLDDWQFDHVHSDGFVRWAHDCYFPWAFEKTEMRKKYSRL